MNIDESNLRQRARAVAGAMATGPQLLVIDDLLPPFGSDDGAHAGALVADAAGARLAGLAVGTAGPLGAAVAEACGAPAPWAERLARVGGALVSLLEAVGPMPGTGAAETPLLALAEHVAVTARERPLVLVVDGIDRDPHGVWLHLVDLMLLAAQRRGASLGVVVVDGRTTDTGILTRPWASVTWSRSRPHVWPEDLVAAVDTVRAGPTRDVLLTASLCGDTFPIHPVLDALGVAWQGDAADDAIDAFDDEVVDGAELALDSDGAHPYVPLVAYRFASTAIRARARRCLVSEADAGAIRERAARMAQHLEDSGVTDRDPRAAAVATDLWTTAEMPHRAELFVAQRLWRRLLHGDPDFTRELLLRAAWHGADWTRDLSRQIGELPRMFGTAHIATVRPILDRLAAA